MTESTDTTRDDVATGLDIAARVAAGIAEVPNPEAKFAAGLAAAALKLAATLTRELGRDDALEALEEIQRRIDSGAGQITEGDLTADNREVAKRLDELFGPKPS